MWIWLYYCKIDQKLDELLTSFDGFKQMQQDSQSAITNKLAQMEMDIQDGQVGTVERIVKKLK